MYINCECFGNSLLEAEHVCFPQAFIGLAKRDVLSGPASPKPSARREPNLRMFTAVHRPQWEAMGDTCHVDTDHPFPTGISHNPMEPFEPL